MPVSESEKLGVHVPGYHFSEKAEHIPIKKRRILFMASSPPHNTTNAPPEETSPNLNSNASSVPATHEAVTGICEKGSEDHKPVKKELVKEDDFSGTSVIAAAAASSKSLVAEADQSEGSGMVSSVTKTPEVPKPDEKNVKKEPVSHTSTTPSKADESAVNNSSSHVPLELALSKPNEEPSIQKSPARDVRFSWDLNTVMDAWEEPIVSEHETSNDKAAYAEQKKNENPSESITNQSLPVELNNLAHENRELKMEKREPLSVKLDSAQHAVVVKTETLEANHIPVTRTLSLEKPTHGIILKSVGPCDQSPSKSIINQNLPFELNSLAYANKEIKMKTCEPLSQHAVVVKTEPLHGNRTDNASDIIPVTTTLSLENPTHGIFSNCANLCGQSSAVDTKLSIDCSIPLTTQTVMGKSDLSLNTATSVENGPHQSGNTSNKVEDEAITKMELTSNVGGIEGLVNKEETETGKVGPKVAMEAQPASISSMHDATHSVGNDSQYEDGELRDWTTNAWKGYELTEGQNESDMNRESGLDMSISDAHETNELTSGKEADVTSSVGFSNPEPNELTSGQQKSNPQDDMEQHATNQSDEWKMNVSGREVLPESHRTLSNNFSKTRNFTGRKFFYGEEQKDRSDTDDVETKAEGSRLYRKESLTRVGGPSARDAFLTRGRLQMQGCSSEEGDGLTFRPERSFGRGRNSPHHRTSGREGGMWSRSLERGRDLKRLPSPSYQNDTSFHRSIQEDFGTMEPSSYVSHRPFRSRSPATQEVNDFRARLGLRPTDDTSDDRFVNLNRGRGRGRYMRSYDREGPRGRYLGPTSDTSDVLMTEYPHPFPRRRRCFSPIERGGTNSYPHHQSGSRSPPRIRSPVANSNTNFRRRSRSPGGFRPDARIRRPRSPDYRDRVNEYSSGPRNNNSSPPSSRWVSFKERPVFNRSPGRPDGPQGERLGYYDSSQKPRQNKYYRSGHPGKFSDVNEGGRGRPTRYMDDDGDRVNNGYRRGGVVRRYNMDHEPGKRFQHDGEDRFSRGFDARDRHALESMHDRT